jgi:hypothetical protein
MCWFVQIKSILVFNSEIEKCFLFAGTCFLDAHELKLSKLLHPK